MNKWELTEESLERFLNWLDPDKEAAGRKYISLQRRLVVMLDSRGCTCSEELADKALNNFIRRLPALLDSYADEHNPLSYLHTTAHHLYIKYIEKLPAPLPDTVAEMPAPAQVSDEDEARFYECLEACLGRMQPRQRELVLNYYEGEKQAKIDFRKTLAERMGIAVNALRIRVHRIRCALEECLEECLKHQLPSETK